MAQINIKLTDEQKEEISRIAKEKGVSITQLAVSYTHLTLPTNSRV